MTEKKRITVSIFYQFLWVIISVIVISLSLYYRVLTPHIIDAPPAIVTFIPKEAIDSTGATRVNCGLYIRNFSEFDFTKNSFIASGTIWFEFDPALISLDTISKFTFEKAEVLERSAPLTNLEHERLLARYDFRIKFFTNLNFLYFPLDDHAISIAITHNTLTPYDIKYDSNEQELMLSESLNIPSGWRIIDKNVHAGFMPTVLSLHGEERTYYKPAVVFTIDFLGVGWRHIISIIMPLFVIFFLTLFMFSLQRSTLEDNAFVIASTAVGSLLAYRFVIESISPQVEYFMIADYLFFLFLGILLLVNLLSALSSYFNLITKEALIVIFHIIVIVGYLYVTVVL